ncbi:TadE/TadG family type IV pilus assembly protein [Sphingomonas sp. Leaf21]|uniref:TadE/TadG family type IV pilus assembly protein n=1 Tax=Sphingomonas sp. Leaf21 TaxID=2876550 RepID=UPI002E79E84B|nr:TadE/TadG family type IV pilus assembly protein [Sphingomonas sp. Leaf21]
MMRLVKQHVRVTRDRRGIAMIEFALAAPVVLLLGLGGVEIGNYVMANLRVSQIAMAVADNAGRVRTSIDEADITEIMIGAMKMGEPLSLAANGRIILSDLEQRTTTTGTGGKGTVSASNPSGYRQWIRWQRCAGAMATPSSLGVPLNARGGAVTDLNDSANEDHGAVEGASVIDGVGKPGNQIAAAGGTAVMVVEVVYDYQPVAPVSLVTSALGSLRIRRSVAFNVRERTAYSLRNDGNLTGPRRADCQMYSAAVPMV